MSLLGTDKQISWATKLRDERLPLIQAVASDEDYKEIASVTRASWWIDTKSYPINSESIKDLVGAAWLTNTGINQLPTASASKVRQGLRNDATLEPLKYSFGTMCAAYTHLLTLKNGSRFVVAKNQLSEFL